MYFCENCNAEFELPLDGRCPACGAGKRRLRRFGVRDYNEKPTPVYKTNTHRDESPRRRPNPKTMVILAALLALGGAGAVFFLVAGPGEPVQGLSDDTYVEIWRETYEERGSSPEAWDEALSEYGTNLEEFDEFTRELRDDNSRYNEISAEINDDPAAAAAHAVYSVELSLEEAFGEARIELDDSLCGVEEMLDELLTEIQRQLEEFAGESGGGN